MPVKKRVNLSLAPLVQCPGCDGVGTVGGCGTSDRCPLCTGAGRVTPEQAARYDPYDDFFGAEPTGDAILELFQYVSAKDAFQIGGSAGLVLSESELSSADLSGVTFFGCEFDCATFARSTLTGTGFRGCNLSGTDFSDAQLSGSWFIDCSLDESNFDDADLSGATFSEVDLTFAPIEDAALMDGLRLVAVDGISKQRANELTLRGAVVVSLRRAA